MSEQLLQISGPDAFAEAFAVSRETRERLEVYAAALRHWQKAVNLVAPESLDDLWQRHFADSAQLLDLAPDAWCWIDLGAGAGFPGLVIAILLTNRPGSVVHLVESRARKCAFLAEVARQTGASVEIHQLRIETLADRARLPTPDIVTARALAPLDRLLEWSAPLFGPESRGLFLKGRGAEREVAEARARWRFEAELVASRTEKEARIVDVRGIAPLNETTA